jgi:hypothetical protein
VVNCFLPQEGSRILAGGGAIVCEPAAWVTIVNQDLGILSFPRTWESSNLLNNMDTCFRGYDKKAVFCVSPVGNNYNFLFTIKRLYKN